MPTWDGFLVTVLEVLKTGETLRAREVHDRAADQVGLTSEQRAEVLDSRAASVPQSGRMGGLLADTGHRTRTSASWCLHDH